MPQDTDLIRLAYVVHTFDMGGLERCIARLVNNLDPSQFIPTVICLNRNGDAAGWIERADVPVVALHKRPGNDPLVIWRLSKTLREHNIDIVHSHNWGTLLETTLARRLARIPIHIHAEHGLELADLRIGDWRRRLRGRTARWALRQADVVVAVADGVRERLTTRFGHPAEKVRLIPNGVDSMTGNGSQLAGVRLRRSLGIPEDAFVVGSVGRLAPVKDFGTAVEAVGLMVGKGMNVHLVLVGDGPQRDSLAARADAAGMESHTHLVGRQTDVGDWLAAMDLYVNSSLNEGMSLSILEAMAAGLPLVVTDVGENAALVDGRPACGRIVPSAAPDQLAQAMEQLLEDNQSRKQMSNCSRERFQRLYSTQQMVSCYESLYRTACSRRPKRVRQTPYSKADK